MIEEAKEFFQMHVPKRKSADSPRKIWTALMGNYPMMCSISLCMQESLPLAMIFCGRYCRMIIMMCWKAGGLKRRVLTLRNAMFS